MQHSFEHTHTLEISGNFNMFNSFIHVNFCITGCLFTIAYVNTFPFIRISEKCIYALTHLQLLGGPVVVYRQRTDAEEKVQRQDAAVKHGTSQHLFNAVTATVQQSGRRNCVDGVNECRPRCLCPTQVTGLLHTWFNPLHSQRCNLWVSQTAVVCKSKRV